MHVLLAGVVLLGGLAAPAMAFVGQPAPAVALKALDGKPFKSPAPKDKRAQLMVFWASW